MVFGESNEDLKHTVAVGWSRQDTLKGSSTGFGSLLVVEEGSLARNGADSWILSQDEWVNLSDTDRN